MSRFPTRDVSHRTPGPAVHAASDGQEGVLTGTLHTAPVGGRCQVVVPAINPLAWRTALVSPAFTGNVGDSVLVAFDENKQPWVISPTGVIQPPQPTLETSLPPSPFDGQVIDYLADSTNGVMWRLRFRGASPSSHKWEFIGGSPLVLGPQGSITTASPTYVALTGGPSWTCPLAGDYEIVYYGTSQVSVASSVTNQSWVLMFNGTFNGFGAYLDAGGAAFVGGTTSLAQRVNGLTASEVISLGVASSNGATSIQFTNGELVIRPIRVG